MCGRFGQTERSINDWVNYRQLDVQLSLDLFPGDNYNVSHSNPAFIVYYDAIGRIHGGQASFAYRPIYGFKRDLKTKELEIDPKSGYPIFDYKKAKASINARAEGKEGRNSLNESNDMAYSGPFNIFRNSGFAKDAATNRCIIPVDYFIEGPEKERLSKPYLIRRSDQRPFGLAGFYSDILDRKHMAIITTPAAPLLHNVVNHHRSPLLIPDDKETLWLDPSAAVDDLEGLIGSFDSTEFEAVPLSINIKAPNNLAKPNNSVDLIEPIGEAIRN